MKQQKPADLFCGKNPSQTDFFSKHRLRFQVLLHQFFVTIPHLILSPPIIKKLTGTKTTETKKSKKSRLPTKTFKNPIGSKIKIFTKRTKKGR